MLAKDDKKFIQEAIDGSVNGGITKAFNDFYENIFEPYITKNEAEHKEIIAVIKGMKKDITVLQDDHTTTKEHLKDHEKRIRKVEAATGV
jgi:hypothetical protein